ncbi:MAG: glycosyltransferase family 4 protein [Cyanobacteria bacterium SBLK]|nr:glycosyltransferase family 4 protein [Cyanobacteria bacterium SBLK]
MKILVYSPLFYPSVGGVESVTEMLAGEWVQLGAEVKLISQTPDRGRKSFPFEIFRQPGVRQQLKLMQWCDIYLQSCISLKGLWLELLHPKPLAFIHHTWYNRPDGSIATVDRLKLWVTRFATNISVSEAIASHLPISSTIIHNPYRDDIFQDMPEIRREKELVFVGRLVSDKGVDLLLDSLWDLKQKGLFPQLTIIGEGADKNSLQQQAKQLQIDSQVRFVGVYSPLEVAKTLNAHKILVIPSRWQEPFGIVALEGIACGCIIVGSSGGGLTAAIADCGETFLNGDRNALTKILAEFLTNPDKIAKYRGNAKKHLQRYQKNKVAQRYLQRLKAVLS